jgi:hypothetical protein
MLIGRFVFSRLDQCSQSVSPPSFLVSTNPLNDGTGSEATSTNEGKVVRGVALGGDQLLSLLELQLRGVNLALLVCRWPVVFTCVFFFTSICWDIAGDKAGWSGALWVPVVGVVILLALWLWERILTALLPWLSALSLVSDQIQSNSSRVSLQKKRQKKDEREEQEQASWWSVEPKMTH